MKYFSQFILFLVGFALFLGLQYQYWYGENGRSDLKALHIQMEEQLQQNQRQARMNAILKADVYDLKTGLEAVEEHARLDLGLIKPNETFVQLSIAPNTHVSSAHVSNNNSNNDFGYPDSISQTNDNLQ